MPVHHSFLADFMAWILILFNNSHASIAHSKNFSSWHFTMTNSVKYPGYPIRLNKGKTTIQGLGYFFWGGGVSTLWCIENVCDQNKSHQDDVTILACHTSRLPDCKTLHLIHSYTPDIWKMAIEKWPYLKPETTFSKATIIFFLSSR